MKKLKSFKNFTFKSPTNLIGELIYCFEIIETLQSYKILSTALPWKRKRVNFSRVTRRQQRRVERQNVDLIDVTIVDTDKNVAGVKLGQ